MSPVFWFGDPAVSTPCHVAIGVPKESLGAAPSPHVACSHLSHLFYDATFKCFGNKSTESVNVECCSWCINCITHCLIIPCGAMGFYEPAPGFTCDVSSFSVNFTDYCIVGRCLTVILCGIRIITGPVVCWIPLGVSSDAVGCVIGGVLHRRQLVEKWSVVPFAVVTLYLICLWSWYNM
jgi:hypothetical protein